MNEHLIRVGKTNRIRVSKELEEALKIFMNNMKLTQGIIISKTKASQVIGKTILEDMFNPEFQKKLKNKIIK